MGDVKIRSATVEDIPIVLTLLRELAAYEGKLECVQVDERRLAEHAFSARACAEILVGELGEKVVSYAIYFPHFGSFRGRPWLYLEDLYVQHGARGHRVGRAMMAYLASLTVQRDWAGMAWSVLDWNQSAFAFYRALGAADANGHVAMDLTGDALMRLAREVDSG